MWQALWVQACDQQWIETTCSRTGPSPPWREGQHEAWHLLAIYPETLRIPIGQTSVGFCHCWTSRKLVSNPTSSKAHARIVVSLLQIEWSALPTPGLVTGFCLGIWLWGSWS